MGIRPESSSHWYDRNGNPCYEVPRASGEGMKPTTLREARIMHLLPSVTSVLSIVRKPYLEAWKADQYLGVSCEFPEATKEEVIEIAETRMAEARDTGSLYHAEIERIVLNLIDGGTVEPEDYEMPEETIRAFIEWYRRFKLRPRWVERPFACSAGYGGRIDCEGTSFLGDGPGTYYTVIDWKTQATKQNKPFRTYPEWAVQLAAYAYGINRPDALLVSVCISTTEPGRIEHFPWPRDENEDNYQAFLDAFAVWRGPLGKNFDPR